MPRWRSEVYSGKTSQKLNFDNCSILQLRCDSHLGLRSIATRCHDAHQPEPLRIDACQLRAVLGLQFQLDAQSIDVRIERLGIDAEFPTPYGLFEHGSGDQFSDIAKQVQRQIELPTRQLDRLAVQAEMTGRKLSLIHI